MRRILESAGNIQAGRKETVLVHERSYAIVVAGGDYSAADIRVLAGLFRLRPSAKGFCFAAHGTSNPEGMLMVETQAGCLERLLRAEGVVNQLDFRSIATNTLEEARVIESADIASRFHSAQLVTVDLHCYRYLLTLEASAPRALGKMMPMIPYTYRDRPYSATLLRVVREAYRIDEYQHGSIASPKPADRGIITKLIEAVEEELPDVHRAMLRETSSHRVARLGRDPLLTDSPAEEAV